MNATQQAEETKRILEGVVSRWCPTSDESFDIRMMRALLNLNAYEQDSHRVMLGAAPIRKSYPLPLPAPYKELLEALEETLQQYVSLAESGDAGNWDPHKEAFVIKAKAAIAKAKGEA
jgi:hypothetical protein